MTPFEAIRGVPNACQVLPTVVTGGQPTPEQLDALGYEALAVKRDGEKQVEAYNCVFHALAKAHPDVCRFDLAFMEAATGRPVQHLECLVRGGQSCRFRLGPRKAD